MNLRYEGTCSQCGTKLHPGENAHYTPATRSIQCIVCPVRKKPAAVQSSRVQSDSVRSAGAGARSKSRELQGGQILLLVAAAALVILGWSMNLPLLYGGGIVCLLLGARKSGTWKVGALGEKHTARMLKKLDKSHVVLHDRKVPWGEANLDHVVIGPKGVHVLDTKHYGGSFSYQQGRLLLGGKDQTKLLQGLSWQEKTITDILKRAGLSCPVTSMLIFTGSAAPRNVTPAQGHYMAPLHQAGHLPGTRSLDHQKIQQIAAALHAALS